ncbi:MAG: hypothetical protein C0623_12115 [Desulfuromonas sp.]|nr:MAG: hypothetical protein C0623_12115 [Desulfuromonas sp.]
MKLIYSLKLEDAVKFNQDHIDSIPEMKRKLSIMRLVWAFTPLVAVSAIMFVERATPSKTAIVISFVAFCVSTPIYFLQPAFFRWSTARQLRKVYAEPQNEALLGQQELEIVGNELMLKSEATENRIALKSVEKIISSDDHTYVYTSASNAHIIPKNSVIEGDYDGFIKTLRRKTKKK